MFNLASSLETRQIVYVATNVLSNRPQLNSHRDDDFGRCYARDNIDGLTAVELGHMYSQYVGKR